MSGELEIRTTNRRRRSITEKGRQAFLEALSAGWSVQAAADRAGWQRSRFYSLRNSDDAFAREWDEAIEAGCDVLEDALRVAADDGWDEETYDGDDKLIRRTRRRDPRLLERLLARRKPVETKVEVSVPQAALAPPEDRPVTRLGDVVRLAIETGQAHLLGLDRYGVELTDFVEGEFTEEPPEGDAS